MRERPPLPISSAKADAWWLSSPCLALAKGSESVRSHSVSIPCKNYCFQRADAHPVHVRERSNCSLRLDACSPLFMHSTVVASSGGAAREFVRCTVNVQAACVGTAVEWLTTLKGAVALCMSNQSNLFIVTHQCAKVKFLGTRLCAMEVQATRYENVQYTWTTRYTLYTIYTCAQYTIYIFP